MADTFEFKNLVGTVKGMTAILDNIECDDDSIEVPGVDWFTYAGNPATTIYVNGNNYVGFGVDDEQLKICNDDGEIYYVYRQDGTLNTGEKFLKIRVEGFTDYDSEYQDDRSTLKYELFILDNQTIKLLLLQLPSDSNRLGTSSISDGTNTADLPITSETKAPFLIEVKNAGVSQEVTGTAINFTKIEVTKLPNKTEYYQKEPFDSTGIVVTGTSDIGNFEINGYALSGFDNNSAGTKTITVSYDTLTTTFDVNVSDIAITGIDYTCPESELKHHLESAPNFNNFTFYKTLSNNQRVELTESERNALIFSESVNPWSPGTYIETITWNNFETTVSIEIMQPTGMVADEYSYTPNPCYTGDNVAFKINKISVIYEDGTDAITNPNAISTSKIDTTSAGIKETTVSFHKAVSTKIPVSVLDINNYEEYIGTPNKNDVLAKYDKNTNTLVISGTGNFTSLTYRKELFVDMVRKIKFDGNLPEIPMGFSASIPNIENVIFCDSIIKINNGNFMTFLGSKLDFPASLKVIQGGTFSSCPNLSELVFHEGLQEIQGGALGGFQSLDSIVFPLSLNLLSARAFSGATITSIEIGNANSVIGSSGINIPNCKNLIIRGGTIDGTDVTGQLSKLENLTLKGLVKFTGTSHFAPCSSTLKTVTIEDGITEIPASCFANCSKITEIAIPASVTSIGKSAFFWTSLKNLVISDGVQAIDAQAFYGTQVTNVSIPASVTSIGENAFKTSTTTNISLNKKINEISGSPWGATGTITWLVQLSRIEVTHMPTKIRYFVGETFDSAGLVITAYYNDNTSEQVTGYTLSSPDMSTYGNKTVTVTLDGKTVDFSILVVDISGIEVKTMPTKTEYPKGDVFDTTGLSILVKYTDGTSETITTGFEVSGFDSSSVGEKTITVTYKTHTATFKVTVYDLLGIRITSFPSKVYYKIGETFDPSGITVAEVRQDGTEKEITDYDISGFDSSTAGSKTITVSYNSMVNGVSKFIGSDSFQIKVTNDGKNPFDDSSSGGSGGGSGEVEEEKTEPINVTVHWINGEFADLTNENIDQNTLTLQESICSEQYFIFGGCVCNQITFQAHHDQFNGTSEEFYPSGKIEVYIERKGTRIKIFTGEIDSAERKVNSLTRNFIAYDYLYKLRNTDIARWYKNQTTDKKKKLTQKQFRDKLFEFLGLEQVSTKLHWDDTYVPDTNNSNEMNVVNILKDLCLQNDRFGWMNRDGKFEYLKLRQNSYKYGQTTGNQNIYKYYNNEEVHLDTFKSFTAKEGRIWFPNIIFCDPDPNRAFGFTQGDYTAQEAYDNNVYYNRNSFFVGNEDWLNYVWDADEYGGISRAKPIIKICYGVFVNQDLRKYYRAQGYTAEVQGNPLNMVGQAVELYYKKQIQHDDQEPTELQWYVHSYIMSRTLKIGATDMIDTYSANNAPFNSNSRQLGKDTPEISATVNRTRSEMPTISYAEFTDGSDSEFSPAMIDDFTDGSGGSGSTSEQLKKAQLRCVKRIKKADYDALVAAGNDRADTLYFTFEEK